MGDWSDEEDVDDRVEEEVDDGVLAPAGQTAAAVVDTGSINSGEDIWAPNPPESNQESLHTTLVHTMCIWFLRQKALF